MSPLRTFFASTLCGLVLFGSAAVVAQDTAAQAKAEGKALGKMLGKSAGAIAKRGPTEDALPNFRKGTPSETDLYKDPDALEAKGQAAAASSSDYEQMRTSMRTRTKFSKEELNAVVDRALKIQDDPTALVKSPAEGSSGECRPIPPGMDSPGWSEATCNSGFKAEEKAESCAARMVPEVVNTLRFFYYGVAPNNTPYGFASNVYLGAQATAGVCRATGVTKQICDAQVELGAGGTNPAAYLRFCRSRIRGVASEYSCSQELPQASLAEHYNFAKGTVYVKQEGEKSVTLKRVEDGKCSTLGTDTSCQGPTETCTDPSPQTRLIEGVPVTSACWGWTKTWQCRRLTPAQDCTELEGRGCTFARQECLSSEQPCLTWDRVYNCPLPAVATGEKQFVCDGDIYCIGGECETVERTPNTEFGEAVMAMNGIADAAAQFDPAALTIFKGTRNTCTRTIFGIANCCAPRGFPLIASCDSEDKLLKRRREEGVCHYVGSYCSKEVLGVCLQKKESHCCYGSKLARIIQEQGRPQLGLDWGKPKTAKCEGFTVDQFSRLDLSKIDFSEVLAEFVEAAKLPSELDTAKDLQARIANYYSTRK